MPQVKPTPVKNVITKPEVSFIMSIVIPLLGLAASWGVYSTKIDSLENRLNYFESRYQEHVEKCDDRFNEQNVVFTQIQVTLAEISTQQSEIQKDIVEIKQSLDKNGLK